MNEKCTHCGHVINDDTIDCPGCGHRVHEERLASRLATAESALEGWRNQCDRLKADLDEMRCYTCDTCQCGYCDNCPCNEILEGLSI